jgi:hypothetical protein
MRRRAVAGALFAAGALATVTAPTAAEETGISGQVESTIELSLQSSALGRVQATVTATVGGTQLSASEPRQSPQVLRTFRRPMVTQRVTVRRTGRGAGQTITFGPQGP